MYALNTLVLLRLKVVCSVLDGWMGGYNDQMMVTPAPLYIPCKRCKCYILYSTSINANFGNFDDAILFNFVNHPYPGPY